MSPKIVVADRAESHWHGTLLATAVVSTAMAPAAMTTPQGCLAAAFGDPSHEYRKISKNEAIRMREIIPKEQKELDSLASLVNKLLLEDLCSEKDLREVLSEKRLDECTQIERALRLKAEKFFASKKQVNFKDMLIKHLDELGFKASEGSLEAIRIKTVHLKFRNLKQKDRPMVLAGEKSGQLPKRHYDQDKGIVTLTCTSGPDVLEPSRAKSLCFAGKEITNCINMIIADGFGDLTNRVSAKMTDEGCKFFWKDKLILESSKISEDLEYLRDAALWIWLRALNEVYAPFKSSDSNNSEPGSATVSTEPGSATVSTELDHVAALKEITRDLCGFVVEKQNSHLRIPECYRRPLKSRNQIRRECMIQQTRRFVENAQCSKILPHKVQRGQSSPIIAKLVRRDLAAAMEIACLEPFTKEQLETMSLKHFWQALQNFWLERSGDNLPFRTGDTWPYGIPPFELYLKSSRLGISKFPDAPEELKNLVSKLEERGMLEEATKFVKANQLFVKSILDGHKLIILPEMDTHYLDSVRCHNRDWMWYGRILELFTKFLKTPHLRVM